MDSSMPRWQTYGPLRCCVVEAGEQPRVPVILCHGYGAPGGDLVGLADVFQSLLGTSAAGFRFLFPEAPLQPDELALFGGRAWWPINMAAMLEASETGNFSDLHDRVPPGIEVASAQLAECVTAVLDTMPPTDGPRPYVLGGFSQGAMLTLNLALQGPLHPPTLLLLYSGTLIRRTDWEAQLARGRLRNTLVLQSHGRADTILPYTSAMVLQKMLTGHCRDYQFVPFDGPHTIPHEAISATATQLASLPETSTGTR